MRWTARFVTTRTVFFSCLIADLSFSAVVADSSWVRNHSQQKCMHQNFIHFLSLDVVIRNVCLFVFVLFSFSIFCIFLQRQSLPFTLHLLRLMVSVFGLDVLHTYIHAHFRNEIIYVSFCFAVFFSPNKFWMNRFVFSF